ncbi:hypothetical protein C8Q76DRAFT_689191 [Earliella scabrosa]|nr:hypothetical protein C8Q76DRAFT_689191 [Earliella scabrosa]
MSNSAPFPNRGAYPLKIMHINDWGTKVNIAFKSALADRGPTENRFFGAWNELLLCAFQLLEGAHLGVEFVVWPMTSPSHVCDNSQPYQKGLKFRVLELLVCTTDGRPLLFVEIKDIRQLGVPHARAVADAQIRALYTTHAVQSPVPVLYAISAFGNMVSFYKGCTETGAVSPTYVRRPSTRMLPADFLKNAWNVDILSHTGLRKMRRIVKEIVEMCTTKTELKLLVPSCDEEAAVEDEQGHSEAKSLRDKENHVDGEKNENEDK